MSNIAFCRLGIGGSTPPLDKGTVGLGRVGVIRSWVGRLRWLVVADFFCSWLGMFCWVLGLVQTIWPDAPRRGVCRMRGYVS